MCELVAIRYVLLIHYIDLTKQLQLTELSQIYIKLKVRTTWKLLSIVLNLEANLFAKSFRVGMPMSAMTLSDSEWQVSQWVTSVTVSDKCDWVCWFDLEHNTCACAYHQSISMRFMIIHWKFISHQIQFV